MKYIGIDIGGTNLKAGLVDETGQLLATRKMKVAGIADPAALAWTIHALSVDLCKDFGCELTDIFSIGVGCPGAVEIRGGSILYTCNLPLRNVPLRRLFHQLSDLPLYIENDANCAALAEYYVGGGRGSKRFITVTLGTGGWRGVPLRTPRLLGAVRFRQRTEAPDRQGVAGAPRQHSGAGHRRKRQSCVRPIGLYRRPSGLSGGAGGLRPVYPLPYCRNREHY